MPDDHQPGDASERGDRVSAGPFIFGDPQVFIECGWGEADGAALVPDDRVVPMREIGVSNVEFAWEPDDA